jgi:hypothetical protein
MDRRRPMKKRSYRAFLALLFASVLSVSLLACEENDGLGDDLEDAAEEIEDGVEDAVD